MNPPIWSFGWDELAAVFFFFFLVGLLWFVSMFSYKRNKRIGIGYHALPEPLLCEVFQRFGGVEGGVKASISFYTYICHRSISISQ